MNILIIHPNCPGQFVYLAPFLAKKPGNKVVFLTKNKTMDLANVQICMYKEPRAVTQGLHPYLSPTEEAVLDGQAVFRAVNALKEQGFVPDIILGHSGWGSLMYLKDLYPKVPLIGYFEWYYHALHSDAQWWPDETMDINDVLRVRTKNAHHLLSLEACDIGITPTFWQHKQFPDIYQPKIKVIHDGIDTNFLVPNKNTRLILDDVKLNLSDCEEIITYVSRGFEAYRGFPQFMDAVRILLKRRPKTHVVIVGNDRTCYGAKAAGGKTYKEVELEKGGYDEKRVHFVGPRHRQDYLKILQASDAHIYLTRPFVLSWSMLEAMAIGCPMVVSATPPVEEVTEDGINGLLADFRSPEHIAMQTEELLENRRLAAKLGTAARETVLERYELDQQLRRQLSLMHLQLK